MSLWLWTCLMQPQTEVLRHGLKCAHVGQKRKAGRKDSTCFYFTSLQKQLWGDLRGMHFVRVLFCFVFCCSHSLSTLQSLPTCSLCPALLVLQQSCWWEGCSPKYHQIPRHSQKPQNSQEQHIYLEAAGGWYRDPLHQWLPPRPVELYWVCAVTVHTWLWPQVCVITAEFSSCLSFRSLWVFFCLPPSWCWSLKARQKCLMYLSLKTSTSSHGIMGIRAQPALKMPCLWLVSDDQSFVCWSLSVYRSMILRS